MNTPGFCCRVEQVSWDVQHALHAHSQTAQALLLTATQTPQAMHTLFFAVGLSVSAGMCSMRSALFPTFHAADNNTAAMTNHAHLAFAAGLSGSAGMCSMCCTCSAKLLTTTQ
jgi:hypothetical protein